jgi:hypothetical protein
MAYARLCPLTMLIGSITSGCSVSYTITLTSADIQRALQSQLPVSKSKLLVTATVRALDVEFIENPDRILLRPEVGLSIAGRTVMAGRAFVEGQIRYAPETGEFFFDRPNVADVTIAGLPESMRSTTEEAIAMCGEAYLTAMPVYRLKQSDFKQSLAKMVLKSVKVRQGRLEAVIGMP